MLSTIETLKICASGKPKAYTFVSSTSAMEVKHYLRTSACNGTTSSGVSESDDLLAAKSGLQIGYGQSKWVSELLVRAAASRGLKGTIVRPGYVLGDITTGVSNTDDFLIRLLKGCIQIGAMPDIQNNINMASVNFVARLVIASALHPPSKGVAVAQVSGNPRMNIHKYLSFLPSYGFDVRMVDYNDWKAALDRHVSKHTTENALFSLLHYVTDDLPANTQTPELDDTNARSILAADAKWTGNGEQIHANIVESDVASYLSYLVGIKFLDAPTLPTSQRLSSIKLSQEYMAKLSRVGGRGANV